MAPQPSPYEPSNANGPVFNRRPTVKDTAFPLGYLWIYYPTDHNQAPLLFICVGQGEWVGVQIMGHVVPEEA